MATIQREVRKRGIFGLLVKWLFIAFNLAMIAWLVMTWNVLSRMDVPAGDAGAQAGRAIAGFASTWLVLTFWILGDIVLGILVLLSRGRRILITEER